MAGSVCPVVSRLVYVFEFLIVQGRRLTPNSVGLIIGDSPLGQQISPS